jgi:hypothetical protein
VNAGEAAAAEVARLRTRMELGADDSWAVPLPDGLDTRLLHHLPPPPAGVASPGAAAWRAAFRPALCYYRRGPGFISVRDLRGSGSRIIIDDEILIAVFLRAGEPVRLAEETGEERAALEFLLAENLLLASGGLAVAAPYRMRRWPVPARFA